MRPERDSHPRNFFPCAVCGKSFHVDDLDADLPLDADGELIGNGSDVPLKCRDCHPRFVPAFAEEEPAP